MYIRSTIPKAVPIKESEQGVEGIMESECRINSCSSALLETPPNFSLVRGGCRVEINQILI